MDGAAFMGKLQRGLIVSCQAAEGEPLYGCQVMHLFARCAVAGGAVGIRALADEIPAIRNEVDVPVIGLTKRHSPDSEVYITPNMADVKRLIELNCDAIAIDATARRRAGGETLEQLVAYARKLSPETALVADIDTYNNAVRALQLGFDYISTTLRGYTAETKDAVTPDVDFIRNVSLPLKGKLIVEGGIWEPAQLEQVLRYDPYAVVIGSSITRPMLITERFNRVLTLSDSEVRSA